MSYSFQVKAATKAEAKAAVAAKFDADVITVFPVHARDREAVLANASAVIDLAADDDTKDIQVSVAGYVGWNSAEPQDVVPLTTVSITASAYLVNRE